MGLHPRGHDAAGNALREPRGPRALEPRPHFLDAALAAGGQVNDAVAYFEEALRLRPGYAEAAANLAAARALLAVRDSLAKPDPVPPGEVVKIRLDMWATGVRVFQGHRLRLQIASAALPKFAAHPNTLDPPGSATEVVIANNRVYHDNDHPSRLLLPVMEL